MELKAGYKQTEVGVIPADWTFSTLGELATIKDGTHQTPKYVSTGVPFYSVEHVTSGNFHNTKFISLAEHRFLTRFFKIEKGDILMTRIGSIGDCKLVDWDVDASFYVSLALLKIRPPNSARFISHFSKSETFQNEVELNSLQSAIPRKINLGPISNVKIILPPIEEQEAIAEALSDADALIESLDQLITKKRHLKQGAMQELLTGKRRLPGFSGEWEVKSLGDLFTFSGGYSASRDELSTDGHCYLHYGDIHGSSKTCIDTRVDYLDIPKLDVPLKSVSPNSLLKDGDVVFVDASEDDSGTSRHLVVVNRDNVPFISGLHTIVAKGKTNELGHAYRQYCFQTQAIHQQFLFFAVGTKVSGISKTNIPKLTLPVPTLPEQTAIATILSDMDTELAELESRLAKARYIKQGMMHELLTGQIRLL